MRAKRGEVVQLLAGVTLFSRCTAGELKTVARHVEPVSVGSSGGSAPATTWGTWPCWTGLLAAPPSPRPPSWTPPCSLVSLPGPADQDD